MDNLCCICTLLFKKEHAGMSKFYNTIIYVPCLWQINHLEFEFELKVFSGVLLCVERSSKRGHKLKALCAGPTSCKTLRKQGTPL